LRSFTCLFTHSSSPHIWHIPYVSNFFPSSLPYPLYITIGSTEHHPDPNIDIDICITSCPNHLSATLKNPTFYTPHWGETSIYPTVLRRRSQPFWKTTFDGRISSPGKSTNGFRKTNIYEPTFHWGTTPVLRENIWSTSSGGKPSTFRSFSMGAYPPIGSQPLFDWGKPPTEGKPPTTGPYSLWGKQSTWGKPPTIGQQPTWGQTIPSTTSLLLGHPYLGIENIVWNQHHQPINPAISTQPGGGPPYGGRPPSGPPHGEEDPLGDHPMVENLLEDHPMEEDPLGDHPMVRNLLEDHPMEEDPLGDHPMVVGPPGGPPYGGGPPGGPPYVMTFHLWCSSNSLMDDSI
jgi:hypothetical protein